MSSITLRDTTPTWPQWDGALDTVALVGAFLADPEIIRLRPNTRRQYRWALDRLITHFPTLPQSRGELAVVLTDGLGVASRRQMVKHIRRFYAWCVDVAAADTVNPVLKLRPERRRRTAPKVLSRPEIRRLLDAAFPESQSLTHGKQLSAERDLTMVQVMLDTGIRGDELANLGVVDLGDKLHIRGKTGERDVPIDADILERVWDQVAGDVVWPSHHGGRLTTRGVQQAVGRMFARAGIVGDRLGTHTLRRTFATEFIRSGNPEAALQEILGHADRSTTALYVRLANDDVARAHADADLVKRMGLLDPPAEDWQR